MAKKTRIIIFSLMGVVVFFGLCAGVAYFINTKDISLGKELTLGEPVYISVEGQVKAEVTVYSAREVNESEALRLGVSAKGKTLVAVQLSAKLEDGFNWGVNCMRVRDGKGKYGEVISFRNGVAICRIENPSEQISFFIYAGNWTTSSSLKATGRYKLGVEAASDDPVAMTRRALEENRLFIQGLTMDLEPGFTYVDHFVQENWVHLEYEDMIVNVNTHEFVDVEMDTQRFIGQNRVISGSEYEIITEAEPAGLNGPWYHMVYEQEERACAAYFFVENQVSYVVKFSVEGTAEGLDVQRISKMMETAVYEGQ